MEASGQGPLQAGWAEEADCRQGAPKPGGAVLSRGRSLGFCSRAPGASPDSGGRFGRDAKTFRQEPPPERASTRAESQRRSSVTGEERGGRFQKGPRRTPERALGRHRESREAEVRPEVETRGLGGVSSRRCGASIPRMQITLGSAFTSLTGKEATPPPWESFRERPTTALNTCKGGARGGYWFGMHGISLLFSLSGGHEEAQPTPPIASSLSGFQDVAWVSIPEDLATPPCDPESVRECTRTPCNLHTVR